MTSFSLLTISVLVLSVCGNPNVGKEFSKDFLFGVSSTAYQIEGGWDSDGKGESIWDHFTHIFPDRILDHSDGNVSCDSYHKFREDVNLLKELGVQFYRFSISWTRILPNGFSYKVNPDGIRHYNEVINLLIENNIQPMVTLFDWDTPRAIEELGGFTSSLVVEWFEAYAKLVFENFGDRVKLWITFNDPKQMCLLGYGSEKAAPGYNSTGIGDYMCAHNVLKSHARVYHLYNDTYKSIQKGNISIIIDTNWYEPATDASEDVDAAERAMAFAFSWYADPIYSSTGDYPQLMKIAINRRSYLERFPESRLPIFTEQEVEYIKGTYDFFALNHFTTQMVKDKVDDPIGDPAYSKDLGVEFFDDPDWAKDTSTSVKTVPWGFIKLLNWIKEKYGNLTIFVTANGCQDQEQFKDQNRINYHKVYLDALLDAIHNDGVNIAGYAIWSFMDGFNWESGFVNKYGLYHVNFSDPNRTRTSKSSVDYYKSIIKSRKLSQTSNGYRQTDKDVFLICCFIFLSVLF